MTRPMIPWNTRGNLFDVVRREMDDFVGRMQDPDTWSDEVTSFSPRTNVAETDKHYEIALDLPGVTADAFSIELHEGRLSITGERTKEETEEGKTFHRVERHYGKFQRTFTLGQDVHGDGITATYRNGVLTVLVPKTTKAQPKKIEVKS